MATPNEIISEAELLKVHGNANFGPMTPRQVVDLGVLQTAYGYSCGNTMFKILYEHKLVRKPKNPMNCRPSLTQKGKQYLRAAIPCLEVARHFNL